MKANPDGADMYMGFEAIVKTVSREWNSIGKETRAKYEALSKVDHTRYREEMQVRELKKEGRRDLTGVKMYMLAKKTSVHIEKRCAFDAST